MSNDESATTRKIRLPTGSLRRDLTDLADLAESILRTEEMIRSEFCSEREGLSLKQILLDQDFNGKLTELHGSAEKILSCDLEKIECALTLLNSILALSVVTTQQVHPNILQMQAVLKHSADSRELLQEIQQALAAEIDQWRNLANISPSAWSSEEQSKFLSPHRLIESHNLALSLLNTRMSEFIVKLKDKSIQLNAGIEKVLIQTGQNEQTRSRESVNNFSDALKAAVQIFCVTPNKTVKRKPLQTAQVANAGSSIRRYFWRNDLIKLSNVRRAILHDDERLQKAFENVNHTATPDESWLADNIARRTSEVIGQINEVVEKEFKELVSATEEVELLIKEGGKQKTKKLEHRAAKLNSKRQRYRNTCVFVQEVRDNVNFHAEQWSAKYLLSCEFSQVQPGLRSLRRSNLMQSFIALNDILAVRRETYHGAIESLDKARYVIAERTQLEKDSTTFKTHKRRIAGSYVNLLSTKVEITARLATLTDTLKISTERTRMTPKVAQLRKKLHLFLTFTSLLLSLEWEEDTTQEREDIFDKMSGLYSEIETGIREFQFHLFSIESNIAFSLTPFTDDPSFYSSSLHKKYSKSLDLLREGAVDLLFVSTSYGDKMFSASAALETLTENRRVIFVGSFLENHEMLVRGLFQILDECKRTTPPTLKNCYKMMAILTTRQRKIRELNEYGKARNRAKNIFQSKQRRFNRLIHECEGTLKDFESSAVTREIRQQTRQLLSKAIDEFSHVPDKASAADELFFLSHAATSSLVIPLVDLVQRVVNNWCEPENLAQAISCLNEKELQEQLVDIDLTLACMNRLRQKLLFIAHKLESYINNIDAPFYRILNLTDTDARNRNTMESKALREQISRMDNCVNLLLRTQYLCAKVAKAKGLSNVLMGSRTFAVHQYFVEGNPKVNKDMEQAVITTVTDMEATFLKLDTIMNSLELTIFEKDYVSSNLDLLDTCAEFPQRRELRELLSIALEAERQLKQRLRAINISLYQDCADDVELWQRRVLIARKISDQDLEREAQIRLDTRREKLEFYEMFLSEQEIDRTELPEFIRQTLETVERLEKKCGLGSSYILMQGKVLLLLTLIDRILAILDVFHEFSKQYSLSND